MLILAVCVALAALVLWQLNRSPRPITAVPPSMERLFITLEARVRTELPGPQLATLTRELQEIREIELRMVAEGAPAQQAHVIALQGAVQSMANHLELNRRLPG